MFSALALGTLLMLMLAGCGNDRGQSGAGAEPALVVELTRGGLPIDQERVVLIERIDGGQPWHKQYTVAPRATARILGLDPGTYSVSLMDVALRDKARRLRPMGQGTQAISDRVVLQGTGTSRVRLQLDVSGGVQGRVRAPPDVEVTAPYFTLFRHEPGGVWYPVGTAPTPEVRKTGDESFEFAFRDVPVGQYRLRCYPRGAKAAVVPVDVRSGEESSVELTLEPARSSLSIGVPIEQPASTDRAGRIRVLAGLWTDRMTSDVVRDSIALDAAETTLGGFVEGGYLVAFEDATMATLIDVPAAGTAAMVYQPPPGLVEPKGARVRVEVRRGDLLLGRVGCALVPGASAVVGPRAGTWMRYVHTQPSSGMAEFDRVAAGAWEVWVFDGIGGSMLGLRENPTRMPLRVNQEQVGLVVDVGPERK